MTECHGSAPPAPEPPPIPSTDRGALGAAAGTSATVVGSGGAVVSAYSLSAWAVARYVLVTVLVVGGLYLLWRIQEVLQLLLLAIIFATAIEPLVDWLRRGPFNRSQGILVVYSVLFMLVAAVGFFFVPTLLDQLGTFIETLPERLAALRPLVEQSGPRPLRELLLRGLGAAEPAVQRTLDQPDLAAAPTTLMTAGGALAHTVFSVVTVFLLAYYWLTERATIKRGVLRLVPAAQTRQVNATWLQIEAKLGRWVRGQLLIMLALGLMAGLAFTLLGLPNPLLLAVLAGLCEIIPMVGPFLAFVPALLVALTIDPTRALLLIPVAIIIQQFEGNVLVPRIMSQAVGVSPLTVILGILIGSILGGPAGAFLAVPVAAALQVILNDTLRPALEEEAAPVPVPEAELEGELRPNPEGL